MSRLPGVPLDTVRDQLSAAYQDRLASFRGRQRARRISEQRASAMGG